MDKDLIQREEEHLEKIDELLFDLKKAVDEYNLWSYDNNIEDSTSLELQSDILSMTIRIGNRLKNLN